ncbi:uncharacterized protein LOC110644467 [Hevea brasiliensis]|uniref:uncharacterized protein LOC110644467 n=1 Tax=Hevea brasiliensis TaxID=3981 RepID=UPI0025D74084|nr:uncharacterized protein LOC110644467 [Hevea brasiliensis]
MEAAQRAGVIINLGSALGLYPMINDSIYSASKGSVVMFTRSLFPYKHQGIRINVLCPEFVETGMGLTADAKLVGIVGGFVSMQMVLLSSLWMRAKLALVYG